MIQKRAARLGLELSRLPGVEFGARPALAGLAAQVAADGPHFTIAGSIDYPTLRRGQLPERRTTALVMFVRYSADLFLRPHVPLCALLGDPRRVGFGFLGLLILAAVYSVGICIALAMNLAHLPQFLVLNIPAEQYYSYERFFILPVGPAGAILTSGVIRLVARWWNGQGHFEDLLAPLSPWLQYDRDCCGDGPARPRHRHTGWNWRPGPARRLSSFVRSPRLGNGQPLFIDGALCR